MKIDKSMKAIGVIDAKQKGSKVELTLDPSLMPKNVKKNIQPQKQCCQKTEALHIGCDGDNPRGHHHGEVGGRQISKNRLKFIFYGHRKRSRKCVFEKQDTCGMGTATGPKGYAPNG